ncbi:putative transcription factor & lipid binding HD-SAD family [Helianthus annuus]|uniref:Transcription factor & lipid binding HD-SAD family n=2 Tax=Helianthus annuus TaxID=4232 RepID=A0A9K3NM99_HELAN|nr:homeobox-leucine zipper protein HDG1 isoform X1 [Helianthus annuus]KAF5805521.1 putative transcription factor & lipid binding HD-SAD family [Helianthus annuus]KAJ0569940.1 putative transcription factor & lipid binding HD-SAD family [Helianthus annuus]KAJ0576621.1 putative transcription factor & lipid binding HD-SAD family [Helianthus annuus]KAJ0584269.1 putative transcription factor & lipid binding HD-SAD family [Helianthus annuus]KAJ0746905.1 putative transcription factor & lipid binding H
MSFGGFYGGGSDSRMMMADGSFNNMPFHRAPYSQQQLITSTIPQPIYNSQSLSLALKPKMEGLGDHVGLIGENFEANLGRVRGDGSESRSGGSDNVEGASGDEQDIPAGPSSGLRPRQKYHRHTPYQIQELEASFKDNPHPDEKERLALGKKLNLANKQVKFWFQNRRTQMKTQMERHENAILKQENDKLRIENIAMKEAIRAPVCNNCGGQAMVGDISIDEHHIRIENARLRDELDRVSILANKFLGRPLSSFGGSLPLGMGSFNLELGVGRNGYGLNPMDVGLPMGLDYSNGISNVLPLMSPSRPGMMVAGGVGLDLSYEKNMFLDLAMSAMDELMKLGQNNNLLWIGNTEGGGEVLDPNEYTRNFPLCLGMKPHGYVSEASRASGVVMINSVALVDALLNVNQWRDMFLGMIGSSSMIDVISGGTGDSRNGVVQLMQAEIQLVSPSVPARQMRFIRYCRQHAEGVWAVVDVSVDAGREGSTSRRLPSGCIVHDMPNGCSKVMWIEHTEYNESGVPQHYRPLLRSGLGFGAQKWIATLQRHFECIATIMSPDTTIENGSVLSPGGKRSLASLAQRMTANFCAGVCATGGHKWEVVSNEPEAARILIRKSLNNLGDPSGAVLSASMSVWMPIQHQRLFALMLNEELRSKWDVLSPGSAMQNMICLPKTQDLGNLNTISLRANATGPNANQNSVLVLQDSATDVTGSLMVYAAVDVEAITVVMNGGDSSYVALLPSGFAIVPDCVAESGVKAEGEGGSLLTVGFQILVNDLPSSNIKMESVNTVINLITRTVQGIKDVIHSDQQGRQISS